MIAEDLLMAWRKHAIELRIFGLSIARRLPQGLESLVLPYDERLSQVGLTGTRVDFSQRALLHYAEFVAPKTGIDLRKERDAVKQLLASVQPRQPRTQNRATNDAIKRRIKALLPKIGRRRTRILAHLRHVEGLSCEQSRFASLYEEALKETAG
jgi:hypothetical protein